MLKFLTHTPIYVWAILALLIYRGVIAMRDREVPFKKLMIIPALMIALALLDIATKPAGPIATFAPWLAGMALSMLLICTFGSAQITAGSKPGLVRVRGSKVPLAMMMAVFVTKYAAAVATAIVPSLARDLVFVGILCGFVGIFSGYFAGRATRDLMTFLELRPALAGQNGTADIAGAVKA